MDINVEKKVEEKDKNKTNQWPAGVVDHNQWKKSIAFFIYIFIYFVVFIESYGHYVRQSDVFLVPI